MRIVIIGNGSLWDKAYERSLISPDDLVYCANGGTRHAFELGLVPDLVIGDADSLPIPVRAWLDAHGVLFESHPVDKDATDFELALQVALAANPDAILMLAATGTRLDHSFGNFSLLAIAQRAGVAAQLVAGHQHCCFVVDGALTLHGHPGQTVSLLPWGQDARGVTTENLLWSLRDETLHFGHTRGISNIMTAEEARVTLREGQLLVVHQRAEID